MSLCVLADFDGSAETDVSRFLRHLDIIPDVIEIGPQEFLNVSSSSEIE